MIVFTRSWTTIHSLLSSNQVFDTSIQRQQLCDQVLTNMKDGKISGDILPDLRKAFDMVNHTKLLLKLQAYGVNDTALRWFEAYLGGRKQQTCIKGCMSHPDLVTIGIPQGSILGPLLFLIFINDLPDCVGDATTHMYADDTSIIVADKDVTRLCITMNHNAQNISAWLKLNKLFQNVLKTHLMMFATAKRLSMTDFSAFKVTMDGAELKRVQSSKVLGVVLDESLYFNQHINKLCSKLSQKIGVLKRLKDKAKMYIFRVYIIKDCTPSVTGMSGT